MKIVSVIDPGPSSRLRIDEVAADTIGVHDLRIEVAAAGVNRADLLQRRGLYPPPPGASEVLGLECSGRIIECGRSVTGWVPGDRVMALLPGGGYASEAIVPAAVAWKVPECFTDVEAAAFPEAFLTAFLNLIHLPGLQPDQTALIHGGSGGVGTAAIRLAKTVGARVAVTTGAPDRCESCLALGADFAVDYHHQEFMSLIRGWSEKGADVILDCVGAPYLADHLDLLAPGGTLALIGLMGGREAGIDLGTVLRKNLVIRGTTLRSRSIAQKSDLVRAFTERFGSVLEAGDLRPVIAHAYPLERAEEAHIRLQSGGVFGKIVLTTENL